MTELIWKVWDPRKYQDYEVRDEKTNESFSSLAEGFFVVEAIGEFSWQAKACNVSRLFQRLSASGHFAHLPWGKKSWELLKNCACLDNIVRHESGVIYGDFSPRNAHLLINIWSRSGGWASGEWLFLGFSSTSNDTTDTAGQGLVQMLRHRKNLNIAIELQEMKQTFIFVRDVDGVTDDLLKLLEVHAQPGLVI